MLPGDYVAMKLTGEVCTTISGLSEGVFWDFKEKNLAEELLRYFCIDRSIIPEIVPTFGVQGRLTSKAANELGLVPGIPVAYRAGNQPNNAFSLNVLKPGETAATAGTSGVIYGITDKSVFDSEGRVNTFAHVNYSNDHPNKGVLLCINGTGIQYSWLKQNIMDNRYSYEELNKLAADVGIGAHGLMCYPFGNGAERSLRNKDVHGHLVGINFNIHGKEHLIRAVQEGIAFSFRYGLDIMKSIGMELDTVKVGNSNLFQSKVFREAFVNSCNVDLEILSTDGSQGAARGAGIGIGYYPSSTVDTSAFKGLQKMGELHPVHELKEKYGSTYETWKRTLLEITRE